MTLLIILLVVFACVGLMVVLGEKFGKPMSTEQQSKYGKITWILVMVLLVVAIIKNIAS